MQPSLSIGVLLTLGARLQGLTWLKTCFLRSAMPAPLAVWPELVCGMVYSWDVPEETLFLLSSILGLDKEKPSWAGSKISWHVIPALLEVCLWDLAWLWQDGVRPRRWLWTYSTCTRHLVIVNFLFTLSSSSKSKPACPSQIQAEGGQAQVLFLSFPNLLHKAAALLNPKEVCLYHLLLPCPPPPPQILCLACSKSSPVVI